jgi:glutamate/tyrosine decarboxylase-like PLP-dependent enzyme
MLFALHWPLPPLVTEIHIRSVVRGWPTLSIVAAHWAARFADGVQQLPGCELLNDVVINQVLFRFEDDETTLRTLRAVQRSGEAWMGGTTWSGRAAIRVSVSSWRTTEADIHRTVAAFESALVTV